MKPRELYKLLSCFLPGRCIVAFCCLSWNSPLFLLASEGIGLSEDAGSFRSRDRGRNRSNSI